MENLRNADDVAKAIARLLLDKGVKLGLDASSCRTLNFWLDKGNGGSHYLSFRTADDYNDITMRLALEARPRTEGRYINQDGAVYQVLQLSLGVEAYQRMRSPDAAAEHLKRYLAVVELAQRLETELGSDCYELVYTKEEVEENARRKQQQDVAGVLDDCAHMLKSCRVGQSRQIPATSRSCCRACPGLRR